MISFDGRMSAEKVMPMPYPLTDNLDHSVQNHGGSIMNLVKIQENNDDEDLLHINDDSASKLNSKNVKRDARGL